MKKPYKCLKCNHSFLQKKSWAHISLQCIKWRNPTNVWNLTLIFSKKKSWAHTLLQCMKWKTLQMFEMWLVFSKKKFWAHISLQCMKCKNKFHIEHSENCHQSQPSNFFKVWTFFRCFDRDLWKMRQNNKFDTAQLFNYILNTQKMFHQDQPSVFSKYGPNKGLISVIISWLLGWQVLPDQLAAVIWSLWKPTLPNTRILLVWTFFDVLADIFVRWSRITN